MAEPFVIVNGRAHPWAEGLTLARVLETSGHPPERCATALNGDFVARARRDTTLLEPGDEVTVFGAIPGG